MPKDKRTILDVLIDSEDWSDFCYEKTNNDLCYEKISKDFFQAAKELLKDKYGDLEDLHNSSMVELEKIVFRNGFNAAVKLLMNCMK
jgi:hypothetical protein